MKSLPLYLLLSTFLLSACEDREIKVYEVAKEKTAPPLIAESTAEITRPGWIIPAGWKEVPITGLRAASFVAENSTVDISVVTFPGPAGGLVSNLNRWRTQLGLPEQNDVSNIETFSAHGQVVQFVELTSSTEDKAILGAIFLRNDQSWFVKMTGDKTSVAAEKDNFRTFASSFTFGNSGEQTSTNDG